MRPAPGKPEHRWPPRKDLAMSRRFASRLFTNTDRTGRVRRYYLRRALARGVYPGLRGYRCFAMGRRP